MSVQTVKHHPRFFVSSPGLLFYACVFLLLGATLAVHAAPPKDSTRRAFIVGIDSYEDKGIQKLQRPVHDANDIARDLEDLDFNHKDITVANNIKTKSDFMRAFNDFLKVVKPGDELFFFFSGHGFASTNNELNYLLFAKTKTLLTFAKERLPKDRAGDAAYVRLKSRDFEINYELEEIQQNGLSDAELQELIAAKQPSSAILILDACRTLTLTEDNDGVAYSPTGLHTHKKDVKPGFAILYSASEGEAAIESFDNYTDRRANSLFTDVFRLAMKRPGVDFKTLAAQVITQVGKVAESHSQHQTPELVENLTDDFRFIESVGAERFPQPFDADPCAFAQQDLDAALKAQTIDALVNHLDEFRGCKTVDAAQKRLAEVRTIEATNLKPVIDTRDCDDLAASPFDLSRPPTKPGVAFSDIGKKLPIPGAVKQPGEPDEFDTAHVIEVCQDAVKSNPRISRFALNLARAENARGQDKTLPEATRREFMERAKLDYERLSDGGDILAMNNLAAIYENGLEPWMDRKDRTGVDGRKALDLFKRAAQQGLPIAEFQLGYKYEFGFPGGGLKPEYDEARHWLGLAAKAGIVDAIVLEARNERYAPTNRGDGPNPVLAVDLYKRAARVGDVNAEYELGTLYFSGQRRDPEYDNKFRNLRDMANRQRSRIAAADQQRMDTDVEARRSQVNNMTVPQDDDLALIWFARAAARGDARSSYYMYYMLENARGVKEPQQELAGRYLRAAAEAGNPDAEVQYVEKIIDGSIILRFEDRDGAINRLLKRAMKAGNGKAALMMANRAWSDDPHLPRDASRAAAFAFMAIDMAARVNPAVQVLSNEFSPLTEMAAGHFLVKLGHDPSAVDAKGDPIIHKDELERLEKYYGKYDETLKQVRVKIAEIYDYNFNPPQDYAVRKQLWIWDWGRSEPPTEQQFRDIELDRGTTYWDIIRDVNNQSHRQDFKQMRDHPELVTQNMLRTAIGDVYTLARDYKESFLSLIESKVEILTGH